MFEEIENKLIAAFERQLAEKFGLDNKVLLEQPKQSSFGELAIPVAFQLARQLKRAPKQIAEELAAGLGDIPGVASFEIAGNGYINVRLDRGEYAANLLTADDEGRRKRRPAAKSSSSTPISTRTRLPISATCETLF